MGWDMKTKNKKHKKDKVQPRNNIKNNRKIKIIGNITPTYMHMSHYRTPFTNNAFAWHIRK